MGATYVRKLPQHLKPVLLRCADRGDLNKVVTLVQLEQAKWREAQKTIRTQTTEVVREQSYKELLRAIVRLTIGDNSDLACSIRQCIADVAPGMLTPAFHDLVPKLGKARS